MPKHPQNIQDMLMPDICRFEVEDLFKERRELAEVWMKFQKRHPEFSDLDIDTQQPPNIEALQTVMRAAVQDWEKRGDTGLAKAKDNFLSFSETLVSFSDLFSVIPHGDKYVSLFTGVLSTTVKACQNPYRLHSTGHYSWF